MSKNGSQSPSDISKEFISKLTHGTRSPFNGLIGFSELLSTNFYKLSDDEKKDYVFHINMLSKKALLSLDQFILWLKMREGALLPGKAPCNISDAINLALHRTTEQIRQKNCVLDNALEDELAVSVIADPFLIGQLFSFLLDFCAHYSTDNATIFIGLETHESGRSILISTHLNETGADIVSSDVQTANSLGETSNTNDYRNLGLWLCYKLAYIQNIEFRHELSGNGTFTFRFNI